jgi:hypothetical protein
MSPARNWPGHSRNSECSTLRLISDFRFQTITNAECGLRSAEGRKRIRTAETHILRKGRWRWPGALRPSNCGLLHAALNCRLQTITNAECGMRIAECGVGRGKATESTEAQWARRRRECGKVIRLGLVGQINGRVAPRNLLYISNLSGTWRPEVLPRGLRS